MLYVNASTTHHALVGGSRYWVSGLLVQFGTNLGEASTNILSAKRKSVIINTQRGPSGERNENLCYYVGDQQQSYRAWYELNRFMGLS